MKRRLRTTHDLTAAERRLVQIMSEFQFGRFENISVQAGHPVLDSGVKVVRVTRLGSEGEPANAPTCQEYELKQAVSDLFDELEQLSEGLVVRLEFRRGLPCLIETLAATSPGELPTAVARSEGV